jgi:hypothetical protein
MCADQNAVQPVQPIYETEADPKAEVARLKGHVQSALDRDFAVLTLLPRSKDPNAKYSPHAIYSASKDPAVVLRAWEDGLPCNYAVNCGLSGITVIDVDTGCATVEQFEAWKKTNDIPDTYTIQTGRRFSETGDELGFQMYFSGTVPTGKFSVGGFKGCIKSLGGYVVGNGSVHPISGKRYREHLNVPIIPLPLNKFTNTKEKSDKPTNASTDEGLVPASCRNDRLESIAGTLRNKHIPEEGIFAALKAFTIERCENGENYFIENEEKIKSIAHRICKKDAAPLPPVLVWPPKGEPKPAPKSFEFTPTPTPTPTPVPATAVSSAPKNNPFSMTVEQWGAYEFSEQESTPIIGTSENAVARPRTKNLIVGAEKVFKTSFLMRLMAGLASGETIFPELPTFHADGLKVLYIHAELNPHELKERIPFSVSEVDTQGKLVHTRDIDVHLIDPLGQQVIVDEANKYLPDVICLDPWADLISGYDENAGKDTSVARDFIDHLLDAFKCTVFMCQHTGQDESKGGRGHTGTKGWRDTLFTLKRSGDFVTVFVEPRWGEPVTLHLKFIDKVLQPAIEIITPKQLELIAFLKNHPKGSSSQDVAVDLKMGTKTAYKFLQRNGKHFTKSGVLYFPKGSASEGEVSNG